MLATAAKRQAVDPNISYFIVWPFLLHRVFNAAADAGNSTEASPKSVMSAVSPPNEARTLLVSLFGARSRTFFRVGST